MLISGWATPLELTLEEVKQRKDEGCVVPEALERELRALDGEKDAYNERLIGIQRQLAALEPSEDFAYVQPDDLEGIRRERPAGPRRLALDLSDADLLDRFHGAWTGRAIGCALGKPVEGLGIMGFRGEPGRPVIKRYLEARNEWPLANYFSGEGSDGSGVRLWCPQSWRENIAYMEPDDDIHYSLIGLKVLEEKGPHFTWTDVADAWNASLPYNAICTAETQAILNYNLKVPRVRKREASAYVSPEFTRRTNNPFREWIGAQIRADGWAYGCAGNPELAAELAWRDAHWTHTANGIYGEMFVAALIAAAFVERDPARLVEIGLSEIPGNCRLAAAVREALDWIRECADFETFMDRLDRKYEGMSGVHAVNNALVVVMSFFYGEMSPDRCASVAVMAGLDTDCNGASVGSIAGAATGKDRFGGSLQGPLNDTIRPLVFGFQEVSMRELAERTLRVHKRIVAAA